MHRARSVCFALCLAGSLAQAQAQSPAPASKVTPSIPPAPTPSTTPSGISVAPATAKPVAKVRKRKRLPPPPPPPAAELFAMNTRESFKLRPDAKGRFTKVALRGWNRFLRCHHTGRVHAMSTRLAELIYTVAKHFEFKKIYVVAGYRAPKVAKEKGNPKSPHKKGVACDFKVDGVPNTELRDFERTLTRVGVGYYPNSDFVHLDVDPSRVKRSAFWIDYSRPGERARYSKTPDSDLQAEKQPALPPSPTLVGDDDDDLLAPMPPLAGTSPIKKESGGGEPQLFGGPGATAPNPTPSLAPNPRIP
ncbi:MAG: hypothetical protein JWN44_5351 [Myxococcales bacterium]|nr:hypothetical protein [Myxococcales bacterium]